MTENLLSYVVFTPLVGAVVLLLIRTKTLVKSISVLFAAVTFAFSIFLYLSFDAAKPGFQFVEYVPWIYSLDASYHLGIDGISLLLIVLTTFLTLISLIASWNSITTRIKAFNFFVLLLEAGMLGVFSSLDLFLFYIFWEAMLIPMYFIIGIWGHERKIYAAVKFFIYTMFGSLLMLVAIIWLGYYAGTLPGGRFTTNLVTLYQVGPAIPIAIQVWMFLAFTLSFAIKVPIFPLHTWLPDAHTEAPMAGSVLLAGVLLKMGTYGFLRFSLPLFPQAAFKFLPLLAILAIIGIVYGALVSMVQKDLKKLVAYSSVAHLGFVVLGIFAITVESVQGSVIQMINHGLTTGMLFLLVGMLYDRRHTRLISDFGGIARVVPILSTFFMIAMLGSVGLPGLNGFVGEFLILVGSFKSEFLGSSAYAIAATGGVILAAVYLLWMYQRVFFATVEKPENEKMIDLHYHEIAVLAAMVIFVVWIGVHPNTFLSKSEPAVKALVDTLIKAKVGGLAASQW
ncbi:MAG TPA: NADH-quinone oxidoreductase subunit M [Candidatus Acidoferrales bacterium]|nr:NADH-quinone oxidoreductase subunit M [Candidatus Acidoferrales bacterium]